MTSRVAAMALALSLSVTLLGCSTATPTLAPSNPSNPSNPSEGSLSPSPLPSSSMVAIGRIVRQISIHAELLGVLGLATQGTSVWVALSGYPHGQLLRFDGATGRELARIPVGWAPAGLVVVGDDVWVADTIGDGSHVDAVQNQVEVIDTRTNRVVRRYPIPVPANLAVVGNEVWVVSADGSDHSTVSLLGGRQTYRIPAPGATQLVVSDGRLFTATVADDGFSDIWSLDPNASMLATGFQIAGGVSQLSATADELFAMGVPSLRTIARLDPMSGRVLATSMPIDSLQAMGAAGSELWVGTSTGVVRRLATQNLRDDGNAIDIADSPAMVLGGRTTWVATDSQLVEVASQ